MTTVTAAQLRDETGYDVPELCKAGVVPAKRRGRGWQVKREDWEAFRSTVPEASDCLSEPASDETAMPVMSMPINCPECQSVIPGGLRSLNCVVCDPATAGGVPIEEQGDRLYTCNHCRREFLCNYPTTLTANFTPIPK